jgi:hypothetical protein
MIPSTMTRVLVNTDARLNEQLHRRICANVAQLAYANPEALDQRLAQLDREWDTDRVTEAVSAVAVLAGVGLAAALSLWWLLLTGAAGVCLLTYSLFGWEPLLPLYRRAGVRTALEIDQERYALKALRGDFYKVAHRHAWDEERLAIARLEGEGGPARAEEAVTELVVAEEALAAVCK